MLGENIYKLRKEKKLSQEQLAEQIGVSRQTISNWELNETSPNPEQLKLLSKSLNISIDELLNNDVNTVLVEKISNTEKLAGIIIKLLKVLGILFIIFLNCSATCVLLGKNNCSICEIILGSMSGSLVVHGLRLNMDNILFSSGLYRTIYNPKSVSNEISIYLTIPA